MDLRLGTCAALDATRVESRFAMPISATGSANLSGYPVHHLGQKWNEPEAPVVVT